MAEYTDIYDSPVGSILIKATDRGISCCGFIEASEKSQYSTLPNIHTIAAAEWLDAYFGDQSLPEVSYDISGTGFQQQVWSIIDKIPFGKTITYQDIALQIPGSSARAVGTATGANPLGIIIPCHRVMGSDGKLHGYAGGIKKKIWLLAFEKGDSLFLPDV